MMRPPQPDLWDQLHEPAAPAQRPRRRLTGLQRAERGKARSASKHADIIDRLVPIAQQLARAAAPEPITVDDVIREAEGRRPAIDLGESPDYLGVVMRRAGLQATGVRVRSTIDRKNGNLRMQWRWEGP